MTISSIFNRNPSAIRRFLLTLAIANFSVIGSWVTITGPSYRYFYPDRTALTLSVGTLLVSILLGAFALALISQGTQSRSRFVRVSAGLCVSVALGAGIWSLLLSGLPILHGWRGSPLFGVVSGAVIALFSVLWAKSDGFRSATYALTVGMGIFLPVQGIQAYRIWQGLPLANPDKPHGIIVEQSRNNGRQRGSAYPIIWIVFDELDQHLTFESSLSLPHFDALRRNSIQATAVTPAEYWTAAAIPAMLTGQHLTFGQATENWRPDWVNHSLISQWAKEGRGTTLLGWYHPYCSAFGHDLDFCFTVQSETGLVGSALGHEGFVSRLKGEVQDFAAAAPPLFEILTEERRERVRHVSPRSTRQHREKFEQLHLALAQALTRDSGFTFIHLPLPHLPAIGGTGFDYVDNLGVADRELGYMQQLLEQNGIWDRAAVVVSGDHHFRLRYWGPIASKRTRGLLHNQEDPRTVLLLKLPAQHQAATFSRPINGVLIHDLMLMLAAQSTKDPSDVLRWLDANRGRGWPEGH